MSVMEHVLCEKKPLTVFTKNYVKEVCQSCKYASAQCFSLFCSCFIYLEIIYSGILWRTKRTIFSVMLVVLNLKKITKCKCSLLEAIYKKAVFRNFRKPTEKKHLQRRTALPKTYSILGFFDRNFRSFLEQICYNSTPVKSYC